MLPNKTRVGVGIMKITCTETIVTTADDSNLFTQIFTAASSSSDPENNKEEEEDEDEEDVMDPDQEAAVELMEKNPLDDISPKFKRINK